MSYENMSMTTNLSASGRGDQAGPVAFAGVILVEAAKHLHKGVPVIRRVASPAIRPVLLPSPAGLPSPHRAGPAG